LSHSDPHPTDRPAPKAVVGRVSLYLRQLETFEREGLNRVSSSQLGAALGINDAQVRKDLAFFGQFGSPGVGYPTQDLILKLRKILGTDRLWPSALIGLGNLGRALVRYRGFFKRGFQIVAVYDNEPEKIGSKIHRLPIKPIDELAQDARPLGIELAILCVPADAAQLVANQVVAAGITGILNFAPVPLVVPGSVSVVSVDLAVQLEHLAYLVMSRKPGFKVDAG
jgi:redox-sensing transcriptional repressor